MTALAAVVATLAAEAAELPADEAWATAQREELADRVVDLVACRAWRRRPAGDAADACLAYVWAVDADRADPHHRLAARAVSLLTDPVRFDDAAALADRLLGPPPEGRLAAAWRTAREAADGLAATRHEWVGADPRTVAAAGWVLVDRFGRLLTTAALIEQAAAAPAGESELLVNAARRYAWNHLRRPAPEAATPTHVLRSAELIRAFAP